MRRVVLALLSVAVLAPSAHAVTTATRPVYDSKGRLVQAPFAPTVPRAHMTKGEATRIFLRDPKVADWLDRYPKTKRVTEATFEPKRADWKIGIWWGPAGEIAIGRVDDGTGVVTEAWTGPQVAWKMARGYSGAFGGKEINTVGIWLAFCIIFLLGLADLRRPLSLRNLDLLALLSFSVSLWFFNRGDVFTSVPLAYPPAHVPPGANGLERVAGRAGLVAVGLAPVATRVGDDLPHRLSRRAQRLRRFECDRRRLLRCDRRPADRPRRVALRAHANRGEPESVRAEGRRRRDPRARTDEWAL